MTRTETGAAIDPPTMRAWVYKSLMAGLEDAIKLTKRYPTPKSFRFFLPGYKKEPRDPFDCSDSASVLVRVLAASVSPADFDKAGSLALGDGAASPGTDFCGRVVRSQDRRFAHGQLVAGYVGRLERCGALAEYTLARATHCAHVPAGVAVEQAATIGCAGVAAWNAVVPFVRRIQRGDTDEQRQAGAPPVPHPRVFVNGGSGGVGGFAIQIAKAMGCHVTATCSTGNTGLVLQMGADDVIDYCYEDVGEALTAIVGRDSRRLAFDHAVDTVGLTFALYKAGDEFLAPHGAFAHLVALPPLEDLRITLRPVFMGGGRHATQLIRGEAEPDAIPQLLELMAEGRLNIPIEEVVPFEEVPRAYRRLRTRRTRGKIVVRVAEDD